MATRRTKIERRKDSVRLKDVESDKSSESKKSYEKRLAELQMRMLRIQQTYYHDKRRAVLVFEGWDASGKGGSIRRMTEKLDPRGYRVHAISAPSAVEQGKHYLWRFWQRLPAPGRIAIFDRSWYGRVLVERVEGLASKSEWKRAYDEINEFEHLLVDDGVRIVKVFLHISKEEQLSRFAARLQNPAKRWKLTADDLRNRDHWDEYVSAIEDMFDKTSTEACPWHVIPGNRKWVARLRILDTVCDALAEGVDIELPPIDPQVVQAASSELGIEIPDDLQHHLSDDEAADEADD